MGGKKRTRKTPDRQYKPDINEVEEADLKEKEFHEKIIKSTEIKKFLDNNVGNMDCMNEFKKKLLKSSCSRRLVNILIAHVFKLIEKSPEALNWGKKCIESLSSEILEPKKRTRDSFFFPSAESERKLVRYLHKAKKTMIVCVFTITNNALADAIRHARERGVKVRIISDDECMKMMGSDIRALASEGFEVRVDDDPFAHMHNKFVVIDDYLLITGSFNWTKQAVNKNQENLVVLDDNNLCTSYTQEFNKLWEQFSCSLEKYFTAEKLAEPLVRDFKPKKAEEPALPPSEQPPALPEPPKDAALPKAS